MLELGDFDQLGFVDGTTDVLIASTLGRREGILVGTLLGIRLCDGLDDGVGVIDGVMLVLGRRDKVGKKEGIVLTEGVKLSEPSTGEALEDGNELRVPNEDGMLDVDGITVGKSLWEGLELCVGTKEGATLNVG